MRNTIKKVSELNSSDTLVGKSGGESKIYGTSRSDTMPSVWIIETEHGNMFMSPYEEVLVKA